MNADIPQSKMQEAEQKEKPATNCSHGVCIGINSCTDPSPPMTPEERKAYRETYEKERRSRERKELIGNVFTAGYLGVGAYITYKSGVMGTTFDDCVTGGVDAIKRTCGSVNTLDLMLVSSTAVVTSVLAGAFTTAFWPYVCFDVLTSK